LDTVLPSQTKGWRLLALHLRHPLAAISHRVPGGNLAEFQQASLPSSLDVLPQLQRLYYKSENTISVLRKMSAVFLDTGLFTTMCDRSF
ncbi:MAG: hypothetical protein GY835_11690, partial [bacterium]|nr:hypothetical protein [bacterium]